MKGNRSLLISFILAFIVLFLCSCSARKVNKSETKTTETASTELTKIDSSKTVTKIDTNTKIVDSSSTDEITITPIDSTKEMIVGQVRYKNVVLKRKKIKNNIISTNNTIVQTYKQNSVKEATKSNSSKSVEATVKNVEKKQFSLLSWWWLLVLLIPAYLYYRKYGFKHP